MRQSKNKTMNKTWWNTFVSQLIDSLLVRWDGESKARWKNFFYKCLFLSDRSFEMRNKLNEMTTLGPMSEKKREKRKERKKNCTKEKIGHERRRTFNDFKCLLLKAAFTVSIRIITFPSTRPKACQHEKNKKKKIRSILCF